MEDMEEYFDLVSEEDCTIGQELRSVVHRKGLLHRAVYCWVFHLDGAVLVQRRSPLKKIGANQLDLSVAEHLQPGESYLAGAVRGLAEELGIQAEAQQLQGPLAPTHRRELHQGNFHDVELVQSFRLDGYTGAISLDDGEVAEVKWVQLAELQQHAEQHPECYTQWLLDEARSLGWFGASSSEQRQKCERQTAGSPAAARGQLATSQHLVGAA